MSTITQFLKIGAIVFATLYPAALLAEIYKWVDEEGTIHYGERPPQSGNATKMRPADKVSVDPNQAMENLRSRNSEFSERRDERKKTIDEATASKKDQTEKLGYCSQLQKNLGILNEHTQVKVTDKEGQTTMVSDKARLDKIAEVKKQIAENCK